MGTEDHRNRAHRGPVEQWLQRTRGLGVSDDQWAQRTRGAMGTGDQRNSAHRGLVEQWEQRNRHRD